MKATDELATIWHIYQITNECLTIVSRNIDDSNALSSFFKNTNFINLTIDEARSDISKSRDHADEYVILSLWATFERNLFTYLSLESKRILNDNPTVLTEKVRQKIEDNLEYWRVDDVLNIFKVIIDVQVISQAKQIKKYRDWLAHKNPKKHPAQITPEMAYSVLVEITQLIENHPDFKR